MIKGLIYREDVAVLNVHALNNRSAKYVNQKLIEPKEETDRSAIMVGDFTIPLSSDRINNETENL